MIDLSTWVPEGEAARRLGVSVRTVRRMASRHEIERKSRPVEGRRPEAVYHPGDVDRLAAEKPVVASPGLSGQLAPVHPAIAQAVILFERISGPVLETNRAALAQVAGLLEALGKTLPPAKRFKPWMTIPEAADYSGLSESLLRRMVASGELFARKDRSWKVRRGDLDEMARVAPPKARGATGA